MDGIFEWWNSIHWIIRYPINFWVTIIFMRGILGNDITTWLRAKKLVKEGKESYTWMILDFIYDNFQRVKHGLEKLILNDRRRILWQHEVDRHGESLVVCTKGNCPSLGEVRVLTT